MTNSILRIKWITASWDLSYGFVLGRVNSDLLRCRSPFVIQQSWTLIIVIWSVDPQGITTWFVVIEIESGALRTGNQIADFRCARLQDILPSLYFNGPWDKILFFLLLEAYQHQAAPRFHAIKIDNVFAHLKTTPYMRLIAVFLACKRSPSDMNANRRRRQFKSSGVTRSDWWKIRPIASALLPCRVMSTLSRDMDHEIRIRIVLECWVCPLPLICPSASISLRER